MWGLQRSRPPEMMVMEDAVCAWHPSARCKGFFGWKGLDASAVGTLLLACCEFHTFQSRVTRTVQPGRQAGARGAAGGPGQPVACRPAAGRTCVRAHCHALPPSAMHRVVPTHTRASVTCALAAQPATVAMPVPYVPCVPVAAGQRLVVAQGGRGGMGVVAPSRQQRERRISRAERAAMVSVRHPPPQPSHQGGHMAWWFLNLWA